MIEYAMLIALGFLLASIVAVLFAGPFWRRAVRLTRKRLEATQFLKFLGVRPDENDLPASLLLEEDQVAHGKVLPVSVSAVLPLLPSVFNRNSTEGVPSISIT